ncbi:hypothetical protein BH20CHL6_BH20CHL6_03950 [soil metagenome]|jgi:uncharacterized DUF497 family protein
MSPIDVDDLVFDDENEAKFASHGLTIEQVQQVFDYRPRFYENRSGRRASHVMLGPTFDALLLVVPLEACGDGLWRPVTAFHPTPAQAQTYRSRR